jgi:hypothetical protein
MIILRKAGSYYLNKIKFTNDNDRRRKRYMIPSESIGHTQSSPPEDDCDEYDPDEGFGISEATPDGDTAHY